MPSVRTGLSCSVVRGRIYAIGGSYTTGLPGGSTQLKSVEEYNPETDTWTGKANLPTPREAPTSAVNDKIYVIGGSKGFVGLQYNSVSTVEEYDPATDTWTKKADMPTRRGRLSTSVVSGKIYAIGGSENNWDALATVEVYDPALNQWSSAPDMPTARSYFTTSVVKGKIYALGGTTSNRSIALTSAVEEFEPGSSGESSVGGAQPPRISIELSPSGLKITFTGTLQSADEVVGPWIDAPKTASPLETTTSAKAKFYRARQ